jgi:hypothetical protein
VFGWIYQSIAPWAAFLFSSSCALSAAMLLLFGVKEQVLITKSRTPSGQGAT